MWIAWEIHRRSSELAEAFGAKYFACDSPGHYVLRYLASTLWTIEILLKERPRILFVQNPSLVLAALAGFLKPFFNYTLVIDRHTNFMLNVPNPTRPFHVFYHFLSDFSIKAADLTIVTNEFLKGVVESKGGRGFILTDRLPSLAGKRGLLPLAGKRNVVFVCTYAADEPYLQVIQAARAIPEDIHVYVTGNPKKAGRGLPGPEEMPPNLTLTGFLPERDYVDLLFSADAIMDLTTSDWVMVCGGYEAMAAGAPFITSRRSVLLDFYTKGTVFTGDGAADIAAAVVEAVESKERLKAEIAELRQVRSKEWSERFSALQGLISDLSGRSVRRGGMPETEKRGNS